MTDVFVLIMRVAAPADETHASPVVSRTPWKGGSGHGAMMVGSDLR